MERQVIEVERRAEFGKGSARKGRARGRVPGILYGHKEEATAFTVDPHELRKRIRASGLGRNTVFKVEGLGRDVLALLKDAQIDPVRRDLVHLDLIEVRESDTVTVDVPLDYVGKPEGVVAGGELEIVRRQVAVRCSPLQIPRNIEVDVTHLTIGHTMHASDIKFPEGSEPAPGNSRLALASVKAPRAEAETAGAEGVAAPGAEAAPAAS